MLHYVLKQQSVTNVSSARSSVQEIEGIESNDALHDFGGPHGNKGHDFAAYWVISKLIELELAKRPDYVFVCEYVQDVAEFDSQVNPQTVKLYQLKKKEDGYWTASDLTGQTEKNKASVADSPIRKLIRHVRAFTLVKATGAFVSNSKFKVSLKSKNSSVEDVTVALNLLDDEHTDGLRAAVALEETNAGRTVVASDVDLSLVELCRATLALDDLQTHMTGLMFNFLNQVATEHSGQASSLVETLYARIKERSRRTAKAPNWPELLQRRGFSKKTFNDAVEGLKQIPDAALFRERLLSKLAGSRNERWVARVTGKLTQCSREKILSGTANRWHSDQAAIDALCEEANDKDLNDEALFKNISNYLTASLPVLNEYEIYALAIYEMSQWNLRQTLV